MEIEIWKYKAAMTVEYLVGIVVVLRLLLHYTTWDVVVWEAKQQEDDCATNIKWVIDE